MRAVAVLLALCAGCHFRVDAVDRGDAAVFRLDGATLPHDLGGVVASGDLAVAASDLGAAPPDLVAAPDFAGAFLIVSGNNASASSIDLTKEGSLDWAHWGYAIASDFDHKASGKSQIGNYALTGGLAFQYSDGAVGYKWNDGTSGLGQRPNSMGSTTTGVYVGGTGNGFRVTIPADRAGRHVRLYVGGFKVTGQLRATLSDGSAPAFEDHAFGNVNGSFNVVYDVQYAAAGPSQSLTLEWTLYGGDALGNVTLQSATLLP